MESRMARRATIDRKTGETDISVTVNLDGEGKSVVGNGVPFFDHMLDQLGKHSLIDLDIRYKGDTEIDAHHTVEDVGLALGQALSKAWGDKKGMTRYGFSSIPMNEALAEVSLDVSSRPFCVFTADLPRDKVGEFDVELAEEFIRALCNSAGLTAHVTLKRGGNLHHCLEAIFKALARALGQAVSLDPRLAGSVPSTKGIL